MIVVGVGCRAGCEAHEIVLLVERLLKECDKKAGDVAMLATSWRKADEKGITEAAKMLNLPLVLVIQPALEAVNDAALARSELVQKIFNIPSVSETSALAMAGDGAKLLCPRMVTPMVVCAVAESELA